MVADMHGIVLAVLCLTLFISRHPPYDIHTCPFDEFITRIHSNDMSSLELVFAVEPIGWCNLLSVFPATQSGNRNCIAITA